MNERQNADLALAAWHVAQGRIIVARQRERIARLRALGCTTLDHEQTLNVFVSTLKIFIDHEQALREGIHVTKKSDGSPRAQACETDRGEYREVAGSD